MYIQFTFGYQKNISEILFKVALNTKTVTQKNILLLSIHWNLSNPTHQGTREMCRIVQDVGILRFYFS